MGLTQKLGLLAQGVISDSSLNIGVGAAPSGSYKLDVNGTGRFSGDVTVGSITGSTTTPNNITLGSSYGTTIANGIKLKLYDGGGSIHGMGIIASNLYLNTNDESTDITLNTNSTERLRISATGAATFASLAGTGTRMVVSDSTGLLSTQAIPGGGGGGSVDELQVALLSQVFG